MSLLSIPKSTLKDGLIESDNQNHTTLNLKIKYLSMIQRIQ